MLHILNGSALLERFPSDIEGQKIACNECLIEGPVKAKNLKDFGKLRSKFLHEAYNASYEEYYNKMVVPFEILETITPEHDLILWFEEDLFCQVNMWFMIHLISHYNLENSVYIVRPHTTLQYGFGSLDEAGLKAALEKKELISKEDLLIFDELWRAYSNSENTEMATLAELLSSSFPFVRSAVEAHFDRKETPDNIGLPKTTLLAIAQELKTKEFGPIFREFSNRLPIYGFGDSQVLRLWQEVQQ